MSFTRNNPAKNTLVHAHIAISSLKHISSRLLTERIGYPSGKNAILTLSLELDKFLGPFLSRVSLQLFTIVEHTAASGEKTDSAREANYRADEQCVSHHSGIGGGAETVVEISDKIGAD